MQREGFKKAPDLDSITFNIESDTDGDLLPIFGEVCDVIDRILLEGEGVLVMDVGGGVATLAAYSKCSISGAPMSSARQIVDTRFATVMKKHNWCWPEAMTVITRARLKQVKPRLLPRKRIVEMLHNDIWQEQLEMWQVCEHNIYENTVVNPDDPRERWRVEKVRESPQEKKINVPPELNKLEKRFAQISEHPHRLSTIEEVEEEAHRRSMIGQIEEETRRPSEIEDVEEEIRRLSASEEVEERLLIPARLRKSKKRLVV